MGTFDFSFLRISPRKKEKRTTRYFSIMNFVPFACVIVSVLSHVKCENINLAEFDERAAIINGYDAPNRPFYVEILWNGSFTCGGTVIKKNFVLTAAHCFYHRGDGRIDILVGDFSNPNSKKTRISAKAIINPSYNGVASYNVGPIKYDVAVLKLSKSVSSSRILPMCTKSYSDYTIKVCGLGRTNATDTNSADPPQLKETELQEKSSCEEFDRNTQICLGTIKGGGDSCMGDSGGPAFPLSPSSGQPICVYGIVSYGADNGPLCGGDTIYTRVSAYRNWIDQQLQ